MDPSTERNLRAGAFIQRPATALKTYSGFALVHAQACRRRSAAATGDGDVDAPRLFIAVHEQRFMSGNSCLSVHCLSDGSLDDGALAKLSGFSVYAMVCHGSHIICAGCTEAAGERSVTIGSQTKTQRAKDGAATDDEQSYTTDTSVSVPESGDYLTTFELCEQENGAVQLQQRAATHISEGDRSGRCIAANSDIVIYAGQRSQFACIYRLDGLQGGCRWSPYQDADAAAAAVEQRSRPTEVEHVALGMSNGDREWIALTGTRYKPVRTWKVVETSALALPDTLSVGKHSPTPIVVASYASATKLPTAPN